MSAKPPVVLLELVGVGGSHVVEVMSEARRLADTLGVRVRVNCGALGTRYADPGDASAVTTAPPSTVPGKGNG